ncbi:MAG: histidine phosphatase family protein [Pyramidobacter sp.]
MERLYLIRHGAAESNLKRLYLGRNDVPLCQTGVQQAQDRAAQGLPAVEQLFSSPLSRCLQTAHILYPALQPVVIDEFMEIDFGRFEGKSHRELLKSDADYGRWLASGGEAPIPGGESMKQLKERVKRGFFKLLKLCTCSSAAAVVHGGTIMALLSELCAPPRSFYDGFTQNCGIVPCRWDGVRLAVVEENSRHE